MCSDKYEDSNQKKLLKKILSSIIIKSTVEIKYELVIIKREKKG